MTRFLKDLFMWIGFMIVIIIIAACIDPIVRGLGVPEGVFFISATALGGFSLAALFISGARKEKKEEREKQLAEEQQRLQYYNDRIQNYRNQLIGYGDQSLVAFEEMPILLKTAERYLDQAEYNFEDHAFAPFWDSIEKAVEKLARFDENTRLIKSNLYSYNTLLNSGAIIGEYQNAQIQPAHMDSPPVFPLSHQSISKLDVGTGTAERLKAIVRKAQRDFQFSTIYEQRKGNRILVEGFTNLAESLEDMTWKITDSLDDLSDSIYEMSAQISESIETTTDLQYQLSREASEQAKRENDALEMLDNIQRGRKPLL